jgi:hypothetical protein
MFWYMYMYSVFIGTNGQAEEIYAEATRKPVLRAWAVSGTAVTVSGVLMPACLVILAGAPRVRAGMLAAGEACGALGAVSALDAAAGPA